MMAFRSYYKQTIQTMKPRWFTLLVFVLFLIINMLACKEKTENEAHPKVLLSEAQMIDIILDVHLVEGALNFKRNLGQSMDDQKNLYFDQLFREHGISQRLFQDNLFYYNRIPMQMENIYDSVTRRLERMQEEIEIEKLESTAE